MSQARLHARAGSPDPSEGTVVVGCTAQGRVLRNRPIKFKKRHRGLTESVRCLVTNVTKGRRKHKHSERHAGAQTLTRYTLEKPQHRIMRFGWRGSGAGKPKRQARNARAALEKTNLPGCLSRTDSRRSSSIGTEDHVAVFPEHQDGPSSAATYLAAGSGWGCHGTNRAVTVVFSHCHGSPVCLRAPCRRAERRCGLRSRPASTSQRSAEP